VVEPSKFGQGDQVRIRFDLKARGYEDRSVFGYCSATFSPSSKLFQWTKAAFGGREIPASYDLDTDQLLDRRVLITLVQRAGDDGVMRNRIDSVRAVNGSRPAPAAVRTPAPGPAPTSTAASSGPRAAAPTSQGNGGAVIPRTGQGASVARVNEQPRDEAPLPDWLQDPGEPGGGDSDLPF
jgi:hypothetical protein